MTNPAYASLFWQGVHAGDFSSPQNGVGWCFVLPGDVQDSSKAAPVEGIELSFLPRPQGPRLAAVQKGAYNACSIDLNLGVV